MNLLETKFKTYLGNINKINKFLIRQTPLRSQIRHKLKVHIHQFVNPYNL